MNVIEDTRQLFNARLETFEAKIDGKLALIFQRLDAMPGRSEIADVRKLETASETSTKPPLTKLLPALSDPCLLARIRGGQQEHDRVAGDTR